MEISPALALGRRLLREHGLEHWSVTTDRAKTRAGVCRFASRTISLSAPLTRLHGEAEVRDTILHEIAHALVGPAHGHDEVWRAKARAIGCSGERTVPTSAPSVEGPWRGVCPHGHVSTRHRRPTRVLSCSRCRHGFDPEFVLTWTFHGRRVPMGQAYRAELEALTLGVEASKGAGSDAAAAAHAAFAVGAMVRIVADGPMNGLVGEVEGAFSTRSQVRVGDELYAVPNEVLASAELVAS
ncbi:MULTISPECIES: SprT-like domain-containing protein [unclassified Knoellia]|uniref:SprT-like domain-containing protein n=1 Tax=Knoellia altitudinis TaxID=3404795 RepID=UPI00361C32B7